MKFVVLIKKKEQTLKDKTLSRVIIFYLTNGWSDRKKVVENYIAFYEKREKLAHERKILYGKIK